MMQSTTRKRSRLAAAAGLLLLALALLALPCAVAMAAEAVPQAAPTLTQPTTILGLGGVSREADGKLTLALGDTLLVKLDGTAPLKAGEWKLYLNGIAIGDLGDYSSVRDDGHTLAFRLVRNDKNKNDWAAVIGSPQWTPNIQASVAKTANESPLLRSNAAGDDIFRLSLVNGPRLLAIIIVPVLIYLFFNICKSTSLLRDDLIKQIPVDYRCFSLGRCQMAFWFVLVSGSFLFLWFLLGDANTLTDKTLLLLGITIATGISSLVANNAKSAAISALEDKLKDKGFESASDIIAKLDARRAAVERRDAIGATQDVKDASNAEIAKLDGEIGSFKEIAKNYLTETRNLETGEVSRGRFFRDLVNDSAGPTLHRLQMVCWTIILGGVFVVGVYQTLVMPDFSTTLLGLMGITSAGYVGFKYVEAT